MPNYSYECQDCHHLFEIKVSIKNMEKGHFACDNCGSLNTRRSFNGFGYCSGSGSRDRNSSNCSTCQRGSCSTCNH